MLLKRIAFLVVFVVLAVPQTALADTSLRDTLIATYQSNPRLQAERDALRAVNERYPQAIAGWRPTIVLQGSAALERQNFDSTTTQKESRNPVSLGLTATQPIYRGGRTDAAQSRAINEIQQQRAQLQAVEQDIFLQAVQAYVNVMRDFAVLRLNEKNEEVLKRNLEATQDRFKVGEVTITDVAQAESRLAQATAETVRALGSLTSSKANYERLVGRAPADLAKPSYPLTFPETQEEALKIAAKENPRIVAAQFGTDAARFTVHEQIGVLYPELSVSADLRRDMDSSPISDTIDTARASLNLTVPLYQSGAEFSRIRQARQIAAQQRSLLLDTQRGVAEAVISAWDDLKTTRAQIASFNTAISAAEIALEGVRQESLVGSRTVLDVLDAERELLNARVNLVRAESAEILAQYTLQAAIGRLTAQYLQLETALYDPTVDFEAVRGQWFGLGEDAGSNP